jgi:hypothetical protein
LPTAGSDPRWNARFDRLWRDRGLEPAYAAWSREHRKLIRIVKAETLFGIGVKLSVTEHFDDADAVNANEDARRSIAALTGVDFIAATGELEV